MVIETALICVGGLLAVSLGINAMLFRSIKRLNRDAEGFNEMIQQERQRRHRLQEHCEELEKHLSGLKDEAQKRFKEMEEMASRLKWAYRQMDINEADAQAWRNHKARMSELGRKGALAGHAKRKAKKQQMTENLEQELTSA